MPEPGPPLARAWRGIASLVVAVWFVALAWRAAPMLAAAWTGAGRALSTTEAERIERASGVSEVVLGRIRELAGDTRLVLYSPYGGAQFELDAADPRGEPARQVRGLFERVKNLLYPKPRDVHFARDAAELLGKLDGRQPGSVLVLDGTVEPEVLAVGGKYELLLENPPGAPRLRLWRWKGNV